MATDSDNSPATEIREKWYSAVYRDANDPIIIEDLDGVVLDCNDGAVDAYGFSREELIGRPVKTVVPTERHAQADELLQRCRAGDRVRHIEGLRWNKQQTIIPVLLTLSALKDDAGKVLAIASIAADISDLKQAESNTLRMAKVFKDGADPIIIENLDGIVLDCNDEAVNAYGFSREELIGRPVKTVVPTERHAQADELLQLCRAGEEVRNVEGLRWNKQQTIIPVLLTLSALKDDEGRIEAIASIAKDLSDLKQAETEYRQLVKVFMDAADPIMIEDLDGNVTAVNHAAVHAYGFSRDELIGRPVKILVPPERHLQADDLLQRCLAGEEVLNIEGLRWNRQHEISDVLLTLSALKDEDGKTMAIATIAKDISELKRVESDLALARDQLETRVQERTRELTQARTDLQSLAEKLSRYLSPQVYQSLFEGSRDAAIETRRRWLTIFFSDIVGFTAASERLDPEELTTLLNEYLVEMTQIVFKYGGTLDKYIGDAILVFFGDPDTKGREQDAQAAVCMALEMQERMRELREQWQNRGLHRPFHIRIGITSGHCTVGNFGSEQQMAYTVIGRQVNLASRLQSQAEDDGILVSRPTWSLVSEQVDGRQGDPVNAQGFDELVEVHKVFGLKDPRKSVTAIKGGEQGFSLWLDPQQIESETRDLIRRRLRLALKTIDQLPSQDDETDLPHE